MGIIGVVAALTIPTLISKYHKKQIVTSLAKFYTNFNQALHLSEVENSDIIQWDNVDVAFNADSMKKWWDTYLAKYYKTNGYEVKNEWLVLQGSDGSGIGLMSSKASGTAATDIHVIYCVNYKKCMENDFESTLRGTFVTDGKNSFMFHIYKNGLSPYNFIYITQFEVGTKREDFIFNNEPGHRQLYACGARNNNCSALIMLDGWKIADDYPIKF